MADCYRDTEHYSAQSEFGLSTMNGYCTENIDNNLYPALDITWFDHKSHIGI